MKNNQRGFTLVELNLALIFVAILMLAIAVTTLNVSKIYQKGVTLKTVNQAGREVMDQFNRDIATADLGALTFNQVSGVGRLCLGSVSYVYNTTAVTNPVKDSSNKAVGLARINDQGGLWCKKNISGAYPMAIDASMQYTELLPTDFIPLAIYTLSAKTLASDTQQGLVQIDMTLGTNEKDTVSGDVCQPPTSNTADFDYCAVRKFSTVVGVYG